MEEIDKLAELLKRLNMGESSVSIKEEAKEFLTSMDPQDLALAEQKLFEAGLAPEDMRHLCSAHLEMLSDEFEQMKADLAPGHVIHTLISEHEVILGFLDSLEEVNQAVQQMEAYHSEKEDFQKLAHIAEHLVGAEPHHEREEKVLFPAIEREGVFGPTEVMRMEHEDLRRYKREIKVLSERVGEMDFPTFKERLDTATRFITLTLRDHILKENNILYPTALEVIATWDKIKSECDQIGYCCFTPEV